MPAKIYKVVFGQMHTLFLVSSDSDRVSSVRVELKIKSVKSMSGLYNLVFLSSLSQSQIEFLGD